MAKKPPYTVRERRVVAQSSDIKVTVMILDPGQFVPWHHHSATSDIFFCLEGEVTVLARKPEDAGAQEHTLKPGGELDIQPTVLHRVENRSDAPARVLTVQGVGAFDFIPAQDDPPRS